MNLDLGRLVREHREDIADGMARAVKAMAASQCASVPMAELVSSADALVQAYLDVFEDDEYFQLRLWIDRVAQRRAEAGFRLADVQRAMLTSKEVLWPLLRARYLGDSEALAAALQDLDGCLNLAITEFAEVYQHYFNEKMGAYLRQLEEANRLLQELAVQDSLTGLVNHGHFTAQLSSETERARRYSRPLSLVMVDVDDFKTINDSYGHPFGDEALQGVARAIRGSVREVDIAARYGGDEFAVLLPETEKQGAVVTADRLRGRLHNEVFSDGKDVFAHMTVSAGVATFPGDASTHLELLDKADEALYRAKHKGGNRVEVASP